MTTGTVKTQGTRLYFTDAAGSPQDILKVACPTGITGLGGGARTAITQTCLDSEEGESRAGLLEPGQLNVPINFIPRSAAHQALIALRESGDTVSWMVVLSDQAGAPSTLDADNRLVSPGATTCEFLGYIVDFNVDAATNDLVRATMILQRSGPPEWTLPTADLA